MSAIYALGVLLFAQVSSVGVENVANDERDAAYEELANGEARAAIARLETALQDNPDDPALLINLGSAYAEIGDVDQARVHYAAAADSDIRYRLELANGEWLDSRRAARLAIRALDDDAFALN